MPFKGVPVLDAIAAVEAIARGIARELENLHRESVESWQAFWNAFPHVWRMANIATVWFTGLIGRLVAVPYSGLAEVCIARLKLFGYGQQLMRLDDAVRLIVAGPISVLQNVTMTSDNSLLAVFAGILARFVYIWVKRVKWLAFLLRGVTIEEFILKVIAAFKKKGIRLFWALIVLGMFAILSAVAAVMGLWLLPIAFIDGRAQKLLLPQDSKRKWRKRGGMARHNVRTGPDANLGDNLA